MYNKILNSVLIEYYLPFIARSFLGSGFNIQASVKQFHKTLFNRKDSF